MKKLLALTIVAALMALPFACADGTEVDPGAAEAEKRASFDAPALIDPQTRYDPFFEQTDGSEQMLFMMLDSMNDEAQTVEEHGALYLTENLMLDGEGDPALQVFTAVQNSRYGYVMISRAAMFGVTVTRYCVGGYGFITYNDEGPEPDGSLTKEYLDYYCQSCHFPYGNLETMNGMRQDENGYNYFFVRSEEIRSFEYVCEGFDIVQLRVYEKNEEGRLALTSYVDYGAGPAWEIPQPVLDMMAEAFENAGA